VAFPGEHKNISLMDGSASIAFFTRQNGSAFFVVLLLMYCPKKRRLGIKECVVTNVRRGIQYRQYSKFTYLINRALFKLIEIKEKKIQKFQ